MSKYSDNCCLQIVEWVTVLLSAVSEVLKMSKYSDDFYLQIIQRVTVVLTQDPLKNISVINTLVSSYPLYTSILAESTWSRLSQY